jgi:hypothetical protein
LINVDLRKCLELDTLNGAITDEARTDMESTAMDITALVNALAPYVIMAVPYLKQLGGTVGEEAAKEVTKQAAKTLGDGSWNLAKSIWQKLRGAKPESQTAIASALRDVADDPHNADTHAALRVKLRKALNEDSGLVEELTRLLHESGMTNVQGERNVVLGDNASKNVVATGDGIIVGDHNINVVSKNS